MAGYQTGSLPRPVPRSGPPSTPVVNRDLIYPRPVAAKPKAAVRIEPEGIILPKPALPADFEIVGQATMRQLLRLCADVTGISQDEIKSPRRALPLVKARQLFMWLAKRFTARSFPQVGELAGGRDHTTVMHGFRRTERVIAHYGIQITDDPVAMARLLWSKDWTGL